MKVENEKKLAKAKKIHELVMEKERQETENLQKKKSKLLSKPENFRLKV